MPKKYTPLQAMQAFWRRIEKTETCWIWTGYTMKTGGHGMTNFRGELILTHRLSWEMHHGPIPEGMYVCHSCDVPACVRIEHLFLGTPADNAEDMGRKKRGTRGRLLTPPGLPPRILRAGAFSNHSKLNPDAVRDIRARVSTGEPMRVLAREYGVNPSVISRVVNYRSWAHIE